MSISEVNQNMIVKGYSLALSLNRQEEPIEKSLQTERNGNVIASVILSLFIGGLPSSPGYSLLFDAATDQKKLQVIRAAKLELGQQALDGTTEDLEKAAKSLQFQQDVYSKIEKYTEAAQKAKLIAGSTLTCFGVSTALLWAILANQIPVSPNTLNNLFVGMLGGLAGSVPALGYLAYKKMTLGNKTDEENRQLAKNVIEQLSTSA